MKLIETLLKRLKRRPELNRRILLAVKELGPGRTSLEIRRHLEAQGGVNFGRFYLTLGNLVESGSLTQQARAGGPERDYLPTYIYRLTEKGLSEISA